MTQQYENYTTDDTVRALYGANWVAQTFTVGSEAHTITSVKLKIYKTGITASTTLTVGIRATDENGHPTGSDLTSGTIDANTLTSTAPGQVYEIPVTEYTLSASTKYAIVVRLPGGDASHYVRWRFHSSGAYSDGNQETSPNSGSSWTAQSSYDSYFEVWGDVPITNIAASDSGTGSDSVAMSATISATDSGIGDEKVGMGPGLLDEGVGVDAVTTSTEMTVTDAGAGVENPTVEASVPSSDSGVGTETSLNVQNQLTETDGGLGTDEITSMSASLTVAESGAGVEALGIEVSVPISDSGAGSEAVTPGPEISVADSGLGVENVTTPGTLTVTDEGKGAEFAWRVKPSSPMIDALVLPHVLSIKISDPATMSDKKVQGGSLPRRKMVGKPGRAVEIDGWSKSQTEIDALDALRDGEHHTFYPQSGDSFGVLVTGFEPSATVDEYDRRTYRLSLAEAN
jgi:hypothetical protein